MEISTASSTSGQLQPEYEVLLNGPAGTPPAGIQPNFDKPPNLDTVINLCVSLYISSTSLAILIRIYTRSVILRSMGYDDYTAVVSWLGLLGYFGLGFLVKDAGIGIHMWDLRLKDFFRLLHWVNINTIIYNPTAFFAKFSILLQYNRIFNPTGKANSRIGIVVRVGILSVFLFYFVRMFFDIFQCNPREKIWNQLIITGHCYNGNAAYKASGIFNVISDFTILIIPLPSVWKLNMSLRRKMLTTGVFACGFLACLTSIMRTYYTWRVVESSDKSYMIAPFGLWSEAELSAGIITSCLPVMPKFFQHFAPKVRNVFSSRPMSSTSGQDPNDRIKAHPIDAIAKIKNPFAKYGPGMSTSESDRDAHARFHGGYYTLDEIETSKPQAKMAGTSTRALSVVATRQDDLG